MDEKNRHKVIGVMSGTSLDGVDVAACEFWQESDQWNYQIIQAETFDYSNKILNRLRVAQELSGIELAQLNVDYGNYLGKLVNVFKKKYNYEAHFIASHGYTVFHEPQKGLTLQIGLGAQIAAITGLKSIGDFRTTDVALGGQGAPLVPIGDELLFNEYVACLNLGGFSNISFKNNIGIRQAFDICPVNFVLNHFARKAGLEYDNGGKMGQNGKVNQHLLNNLNDLSFYRKEMPKSLGREFVEREIYPLIPDNLKVEDVLATLYEHIAQQLAFVLTKVNNGKVLITGGGAFNTFLIQLLKQRSTCILVLPKKQLIDFKEALIFAFLGALRVLEIPNCLASVTGAKYDNIGGTIYLP